MFKTKVVCDSVRVGGTYINGTYNILEVSELVLDEQTKEIYEKGKIFYAVIKYYGDDVKFLSDSLEFGEPIHRAFRFDNLSQAKECLETILN